MASYQPADKIELAALQKKTEASQPDQNESRMHVNYAEGIKTVRLYDGRIQDIEDYREDVEEDEEAALQGTLST
jgi:hypothetical protein